MVYLRAIALAWRDDDVGKTFREALEKDTGKALEEYFNYRCPFSVDLHIRPYREEQQVEWIPRGKNAEGEVVPGHWTPHLPPNEIVFNLPNKPKSKFDEAIALAAYVDGGPSYLFTCC
jgi:ribosomally synthesized peptide (two-chain TOMM family)